MLRQEGEIAQAEATIRAVARSTWSPSATDGSYNRVAAFAREWKAARHREQQTCGRGAFVPLAFLPAKRSSSTGRRIGRSSRASGRSCRSRHFKLSYSRAFFLRAYPQQTHEMLFDAHKPRLPRARGVPRRGIYDNMRTAIDKVGRGKERQVNARFAAMVSHFLFEAGFCNPAPAGSRRVSSIWSVTATACRPRSPIAPSACGYSPERIVIAPRGKSCASTPASSPVRMTTRA